MDFRCHPPPWSHVVLPCISFEYVDRLRISFITMERPKSVRSARCFSTDEDIHLKGHKTVRNEFQGLGYMIEQTPLISAWTIDLLWRKRKSYSDVTGLQKNLSTYDFGRLGLVRTSLNLSSVGFFRRNCRTSPSGQYFITRNGWIQTGQSTRSKYMFRLNTYYVRVWTCTV